MSIINLVFTNSIAAFPATPAARFFTRARKRVFAAAVSIALLAGGLAPCISCNDFDREEIARIIASQSVLTSFFYHTTLPMKMVNMIMAEKQSATNASKTSSSGNEERHPVKAASDAAIMPASVTMIKTFLSCIFNPVITPVKQYICASLSNHTVLLASARVPGENGYLPALILMLCFFMLPRSSIDREASSLFVCNVEGPNHAEAGLGFLLNRCHSHKSLLPVGGES